MSMQKVINKLRYPENLSQIIYINPQQITFNLIARLKCYQCGLYSRGILCPPLLWQTYKQFKTIKSSIEFVNSFKKAIIFIWKNDGTKSWKINKQELSHIQLKKKIGKQLKGTEAGQSRELGTLMRKYKKEVTKNGYECFTLLQGACNLCGKFCPNREKPPCKRKGMPSLEAIGIDVYKLLKTLNVSYEYPVENYLTCVTMLLMK